MHLIFEITPCEWIAVHNGKKLIVWEFENSFALHLHILENKLLNK